MKMMPEKEVERIAKLGLRLEVLIPVKMDDGETGYDMHQNFKTMFDKVHGIFSKKPKLVYRFMKEYEKDNPQDPFLEAPQIMHVINILCCGSLVEYLGQEVIESISDDDFNMLVDILISISGYPWSGTEYEIK